MIDLSSDTGLSECRVKCIGKVQWRTLMRERDRVSLGRKDHNVVSVKVELDRIEEVHGTRVWILQ